MDPRDPTPYCPGSPRAEWWVRVGVAVVLAALILVALLAG